ncbi:phospholipid scramblase 1-like isoform X2 [Bacillus rossius redtenbacheri]|uniref:phospholipid scramblase 1-like isoform X2 n=1 Tax=Bacillus rossius redtenbacheri TaxID=93214 RepID=UPI002FDD42E3
MASDVVNAGPAGGSEDRTNEEPRSSARDANSVQPAVPEFNVPVFRERTTITIQPRPTVDWRTTNTTHIIPLSGLEFLDGLQQICIQQTVELNDLLSYIESENRYLVKAPQGGETLFVAAEKSSSFQRTLFGSNRSFQIDFYDQSRQMAFYFSRKLRCTSFLCGCCLQELQVYSPITGFVGTVEQQWSLYIPLFIVRDENGRDLYRIVGPTNSCCPRYLNAEFQVFGTDGFMQIASILHHWDQDLVCYVITVTFPSLETPNRLKILFLGAAFLLEYLYFEKSKSARCFTKCFK